MLDSKLIAELKRRAYTKLQPCNSDNPDTIRVISKLNDGINFSRRLLYEYNLIKDFSEFETIDESQV